MNEQDLLEQLFRFDQWANRRINNVMTQQPETGNHLFAHIAAAQQIWHARVIGEPSDNLSLWPENQNSAKSFKKLENLHRKWQALIEKYRTDLDREVIYKNSSGREFNTSLSGILHHVIIHGQHHRAQIATELRRAGAVPPGTDYIFYLRQINEQ